MAGSASATMSPGALREIAEAVAREAGRQLRDAFGGERVNVTAKSSPTDLVSEADHAAERLIRDRLAAARPDDGFLGEEGGDAEGTSGLRWVVDPLDGTINFLFRIPQWAVSIACEDEHGTLIGVVYDPMRDELWTAERDGPALLDGRPIEGSRRDDLGTALVATGFGYDAEVRRLQAAVTAELLPQVRDIRRLGSAALDLAWTAAGRYDAFYERGLNAWDLAAGALLCRRAGLSIRTLAPTPPAACSLRQIASSMRWKRSSLGRTRDMTIAAVVVFCILLLILAFLAPRLSRHPERGGQKVLGVGSRGASKAPGKLGRWFSKPFQTSQKAVSKSASTGRRGRSKMPL
jgi:myo-inositol-1(or 4)-monophosphatase